MILNYTKTGFDRKSSSEMSVKATKRFKIIFFMISLSKKYYITSKRVIINLNIKYIY